MLQVDKWSVPLFSGDGAVLTIKEEIVFQTKVQIYKYELPATGEL